VIGAVILWFSIGAFAQERTVAITVDDLPVDGNGKLISAFEARHVPVTAFVIQKKVESLGDAGTRILEDWILHGFDLGNHTYSHPDTNTLSVDEIEQEIIRGEAAIGPLMRAAGKKLTYFRFPMNHTGDTKAKHDALAAFLAKRGYQLATCTIDNSDYLFNQAYLRILDNADDAAAVKLRRDYLAYTSAEIDYYSGLNKQVFGYEPPHVMLLHDNRLNSELIGQVLQLFADRHYRFVTLDAAQSDAAYRTPETCINRFGWMWGYRWASVRNVKVNGKLELDPPEWISKYGAKPTQ
jgi:peptidoglycan/xylan/chitin deacetylase (PgdA/CDA1 family)